MKYFIQYEWIGYGIECARYSKLSDNSWEITKIEDAEKHKMSLRQARLIFPLVQNFCDEIINCKIIPFGDECIDR